MYKKIVLVSILMILSIQNIYAKDVLIINEHGETIKIARLTSNQFESLYVKSNDLMNIIDNLKAEPNTISLSNKRKFTYDFIENHYAIIIKDSKKRAGIFKLRKTAIPIALDVCFIKGTVNLTAGKAGFIPDIVSQANCNCQTISLASTNITVADTIRNLEPNS